MGPYDDFQEKELRVFTSKEMQRCTQSGNRYGHLYLRVLQVRVGYTARVRHLNL